jgi:hypothetical protein
VLYSVREERGSYTPSSSSLRMELDEKRKKAGRHCMMHATTLRKKTQPFCSICFTIPAQEYVTLLDMHGACAARRLDPRVHACCSAWFVAACRAVHGCGKGIWRMHACMLSSPASSSCRDADRRRGTYVCGTGAGRHGAHTT